MLTAIRPLVLTMVFCGASVFTITGSTMIGKRNVTVRKDGGQEHRWEFKDDGTFVFYIKNNKGIWEAKDDEYAEYFVAGDLLCTRWKNAGEGTVENREWWEIATASEKSMVWTALRENADGSQPVAARYGLPAAMWKPTMKVVKLPHYLQLLAGSDPVKSVPGWNWGDPDEDR